MKKLLILSLLTLLLLSSCSNTNSPKEDNKLTTSENKSSKTNSNNQNSNLDTSNIKLEETDLNKVASQKKLTMVNIWGTFCPPCLEEMPDLGKISNEYKDKDFQIVGIVADVIDNNGKPLEDQISTAKEIIAKTNANYQHIIPNIDMVNNILKDVSVVPTTIFIDNNGNKVGEAVLGAKNKADWIKEIDARLKEVN